MKKTILISILIMIVLSMSVLADNNAIGTGQWGDTDYETTQNKDKGK